jgi:DUF4097 and DUF4098 domain-containing protein YvlB
MEPISQEYVFDVDPTAQLVVENIRGTVVIQTSDRNQIAITAVLHPKSGCEVDTRLEILQEENGTVKALTRFGQDGINFLTGRNPCKVDYTILSPSHCNVEVRCVSSNLVVEGIEGKLALDTVSGGMALRNISGDLSINAVSGGISGVGMKGDLVVKTVSGDVGLGEVEFGTIKASSVSGDIKLDGSLGTGPYHFNTVSGDVRLVVPPETGCEIAMSTFSGELKVGLSATYHKRSPRARQVTVQDGGTEIYMHSMSGDLVLTTAEAEFGQDGPGEIESDTTNTRADVMSVLDRIASGELSVEEGIRLIEEG